jgi:hypothetical protein
MFCKKLCCDITIRLATINFQIFIRHSVTPCIIKTYVSCTKHSGGAAQTANPWTVLFNFDFASIQFRVWDGNFPWNEVIIT